MNFIIKVTYKTGDSFGSYTDVENLDYGWDEETAKLNAEFIIEHYDAYQGVNDTWYEKPDMDSVRQKPWYVEPEGKWTEVSPTLYLLPGKDGKEPFKYCCPWCGYFENLISVEVIIQEFVLHPKN